MKKLKVIMQNKKDDCGMCCTVMILRYYGYYIKQSDIEQNEIFRGTDGINNMLDIKRCTQYYGLEPKAFKVKDNAMFDDLKQPAVLFWNFNHFVVFEKKWKGKYYIVNPDKGRECISSEEFERHFTGMAMIFEKGKEFHRKRINLKEEVLNIYRSGIWNMKAPRGYLAGLFFTQLLVYGIPILIRNLISSYSANNHVTLKYGISILLIILLYVLCSVITANYSVSYVKQLKKKSNYSIVRNVMYTPYAGLRKRQAGDIMSRISNNNTICEIITSDIPKAVVSVIFSVIATIYLFHINVVFTCVLLIICLVISLSNFLLMSKTTEYIQVEVNHFASQHSVLMEGMSSLYFIKANNITERFMKKWNTSYDTYLNIFGKRQKIVSYFSILQNFTSIVSQFLFLTMSFVFALIYPDRLADISIFLTMATLIYTPVTQLSFTIVEILREIPNFNRIIDLINTSEIREKKEALTFNNKLSVKNVSFRYPGALDNTLDNITVDIKRGESVAILGESGAGKTTFINLLLGMENKFAGSITYDGKNVCDLQMNDNICCITQDNVLYNGNLVEYLKLFIDDYDEDKVMNGIDKLRLHNLFKNQLVNGAFEIDENGANLSGGQKQRLALLRMFLKDYQLLILDEPTSHLDEVTAQIVTDEIYGRDATKIIITHDTRLLDKADSIYEIKEHKLIKIK